VLAEGNGSLYPALRAHGERLRNGIEEALRVAGYPVVTSGDGPVFQVSFMRDAANRYRDTLQADSALYSDFALALLDDVSAVIREANASEQQSNSVAALVEATIRDWWVRQELAGDSNS